MLEMLHEESATSTRASVERRFYTVFLVFSIIFYSIAGIIAFFSTSTIPSILESNEITTLGKVFSILTWILPILMLVGGGTLFWFIKRRFNVSFDYVFVEDELRVTKVYNGKSRKYLTTITADNILKIGWVEKPSFADTLRGVQGQKAKYLTPNKSPAAEKEFIYLLVSGPIQKTLYVIECRRELLEYIVKTAGVRKLERE